MRGKGYFMKKNKFYFQKTFSKWNKDVIRDYYSISSSESLSAAFYCGGAYNLSLREIGFVFTEKALYWHFQGYSQNEVERLSLPSGKIFFEERKYSCASLGISDECVSLSLKNDENELCFPFPKDFGKENVEFLQEAMNAFLSGSFDSSKYENLDETYSVLFTLLLVRDFAFILKGKIKEKSISFANLIKKYARIFKEKISLKWKTFKTGIKNFGISREERKKQRDVNRKQREEEKKSRREEKAALKEKKRSEKEAERKKRAEENEKKKRSFGVLILHLLRHFADVILDTAFVMGVVLFVKSEEIASSALSKQELFNFFYYKETIRYLRCFWIAMSYFLPKLALVLSCKKSRRIVSVFLLVILAFSVFLIPNMFLLFMVFALLSLVALQFSMGFESRVVLRKVVFFLLFCAAGYLVIACLPAVEEFMELCNCEYFSAFVEKIDISFNPTWWTR